MKYDELLFNFDFRAQQFRNGTMALVIVNLTLYKGSNRCSFLFGSVILMLVHQVHYTTLNSRLLYYATWY